MNKLIKWLLKLGLILLLGAITGYLLWNFYFFPKQASVSTPLQEANHKSDSDLKKLITDILNYRSIDIIKKPFKWEVVMSNNWHLILDPQRDLKEQLQIAKQALGKLTTEQLENLQYLGVDVPEQVYWK